MPSDAFRGRASAARESVASSAQPGSASARVELGQAEVQDLDPPVAGDEEVLGLEVAVDDALGVRGGEPPRDLDRVVERLAQRQRAARHALAQRLAFEQLGDHVRRAVVRADVVDGEDVRVVERAGGARLLLEAPQAVGVSRDATRAAP